MLFHENRNKQIQVYTTQQHLQLETSRTCEACSIVRWEGTFRRPQALSLCHCRVNSRIKFTYT